MVAPDSSLPLDAIADPGVQLMLAVQEDDPAAFEELVLRYQRWVRLLLCRQMGHDRFTDDLTQEVFLRVYKARESYLPTARFSAWLQRIVVNLACNARRAEGRRPEQTLTAPRGLGFAESAGAPGPQSLNCEGPEQRLERREVRQVVRQALDSLNERQRTVTVLAWLDGHSYAEIAARTALSVSAIKSLLSRARENLRKALAPYWENGGSPAAERPRGDYSIPLSIAVSDPLASSASPRTNACEARASCST